MAAPSFVSYLQDTLRVGGRPVEVPVRADGALDLPAMAAAVTDRTRLIFVCNPNNPTGGVLGRGEIEAFLEAVPATVLVVLDEAYAEYVEPGSDVGGPALAAASANVAVLRTFSKIYGLAGLRIGYLLGPEPVVEAVRRLRHWFDVTDVAHLAALACLGDPAEVARRAEATRGARERLAAIMARARARDVAVGGELRRRAGARGRLGSQRTSRRVGCSCARSGIRQATWCGSAPAPTRTSRCSTRPSARSAAQASSAPAPSSRAPRASRRSGAARSAPVRRRGARSASRRRDARPRTPATRCW